MVDAQGRDTERYTYEEFDQAARRVAGFMAQGRSGRHGHLGRLEILLFVAFACLRGHHRRSWVVPPFTQNDVKNSCGS